MDLLQPGQIRVHYKGGTSSDHPELNKGNIVRLCQHEIERIEHYKPPQAAPPLPKPVAKVIEKVIEKTKASLLGSLLEDNKIKAGELIEWIEKCTDLGDLGIVMKDEGRATVKAAYKKRINELT